MIAIGNERFRGSNGFPMAQEARPEVVVLTGFAVSISPEVFSNKMQGKNGRGVRNGVSEAEIPAQAGVFERWSKPSPPKPVSVDQAGLRIDKNRVGIFRNETGLLCQSVPSRAVVGVLAGDPFSSCFLQAGIQGGHKALIGRKAYEAKPWVGKLLHAFRSAVRRSIIDYQQLEIAEGLRKDVSNGRSNVSLRVKRWEQDAEEWIWHECVSGASGF